jgi:hypothetical protein
MTRSSAMAISERSALSTERTPRVGDACFNDWKRFCFVLREIASGEKGSPLSGVEAQKRAQATLSECGYTWPSSDRTCEPIVAPAAVSKALAPVGAKRCAVKTKLKSGGKLSSPPASQRGDPPRQRVIAIAGNCPA